jgi:hypothetical protein
MQAEIVVYVPGAADDPAAAGIARGAAIVGRPEPGSDHARVYYEGAIHGQIAMQTLADRALYAYGQLQISPRRIARHSRSVPQSSSGAVPASCC